MPEPAKPTTGKKILKWAMVSIHAAFLVGLTFWLISLNWMHGDEAFMIKNTAAVLRTILPELDKPPVKDYAFINVAYDKALIDRLDADGFPAGNQPITDRKKLAKLFNIINQAPEHKLLVVDIFMPDSSADDSLLAVEVAKLPRAVYSYHLHDSGGPWYSVFPGLNYGLADYTEVEDEFLKFQFQTDTFPSVPLKMLEITDSVNFEHGAFISWLNGKPVFSAFVLDFRIRQFDLFRQDTSAKYAYTNMFELVQLAEWGLESEIHAFIKDKVVIIGDFEVGDQHPTMYGEMAGPLILLNLYLALRHGDNVLSVWFPIFLFALFFGASYLLFSTDDPLEEWIESKIPKSNKLLRVLAQTASYMVIFAIGSTISFLLFDIHFNFLLLSFYFQGVEWLRDLVLEKMGLKKDEDDDEHDPDIEIEIVPSNAG